MKSTRSDQKLAAVLAELGHPQRLRMFRVLLEHDVSGLTVSELNQKVGLPASTLAFHLRGLVNAGLVEQHKEGRTIRNRALLGKLRATLSALEADCCAAALRNAA